MPANIPAVSKTGVWYRHVRAGSPPMPGHPAPDGRWQRGEQLAGLYVAQDPDTVWAEWCRLLAELGEPPDRWLPRDLWRFSLNLPRVADMSRRPALRALGLPDLEARAVTVARVPGSRRAACSRRFRRRPVPLQRTASRLVCVRVRFRRRLRRGSADRRPRADPRRARASARNAHLAAPRTQPLVAPHDASARRTAGARARLPNL